MRPPKAYVDQRPGQEEGQAEQRQADPAQGDQNRVGRRVRVGEQLEAFRKPSGDSDEGGGSEREQAETNEEHDSGVGAAETRAEHSHQHDQRAEHGEVDDSIR